MAAVPDGVVKFHYFVLALNRKAQSDKVNIICVFKYLLCIGRHRVQYLCAEAVAFKRQLVPLAVDDISVLVTASAVLTAVFSRAGSCNHQRHSSAAYNTSFYIAAQTCHLFGCKLLRQLDVFNPDLREFVESRRVEGV